MKKINESFVCLGCAAVVPLADKTCRNHCPYCFVSQHVDGQIPGDRKAVDICGGVMYPFEYEIRNGQTKIHFCCLQCGKKHRNKSAIDDTLLVLDQKISLYKRELDRYISIEIK